MRLRRETGDFQIRINPSNGTNAIRTGLSAEDFAGELININGAIEPVLSVSESEGVVTAKTASYTVTYNKETGAVTSSEGGAGGSGGSGGGSGSGLVVECTYDFIEARDGNGFIFAEALPTGLTPSDLLGITFVVTQGPGSIYGSGSVAETLTGVAKSICTMRNYSVEAWKGGYSFNLDFGDGPNVISAFGPVYYNPTTGQILGYDPS